MVLGDRADQRLYRGWTHFLPTVPRGITLDKNGKTDMTWNYRVLHSIEKWPDAKEDRFSIHEVYYDEEGNPEMATENPVVAWGEDICWILAEMREATRKPVLHWRDGELVEWGPVPKMKNRP